MKYIIGLIVGLILTAFIAYGDTITYLTSEVQVLLDLVNNRISTTSGVADAGKMIETNASGVVDTTFLPAVIGTATIEEGDVQVGDPDITIIDFDAGVFAITEAPNQEVNVDIQDDGIDSQHYIADSIDPEHINWVLFEIGMFPDLTATVSEINTPLDGATVQLTEFKELETIGDTTISADQWGYVGGADQALKTTDSPTFNGGNITGNLNIDDGTATANSPYIQMVDQSDEIFNMYKSDGANLYITTDTATDRVLDIGNTGVGNMNVQIDGALSVGGVIAGETIDTGNGPVEAFPMDQSVESTSTPTFATVNTGPGDNELYAMDQDVQTTDSVTYTSVSLSYSPKTDGEVTETDTANSFIDDTLDKPDDYYNGMFVRNETEGGTECHGVVTDYDLATTKITHATLGPNCDDDGELDDGDTYVITKNAVGFEFDMLPDVDKTCSGDTFTVTAGDTITWGMCLAVDRADSRFIPSNAEASSGQGTGELRCVAFACEAGVDGEAITVMTKGTARNDAWDLDVAGTATERMIMISDVTPGLMLFEDGDGLDNQAIGTGIPSDSGDLLQYVAWPITDTVLYFSPELRGSNVP